MSWTVALVLALGLVGVYLLLPRVRPLPTLWGAAPASLALLLTGIVWIRGGLTSPEMLLFYVFSGIAIVSAGLLISQHNPVHAALSFALVVLSTCGLFLLQAAPFLMAATTIVYAGAIVVTFLFVIMLAQQAGLSDADQRSREPFLATLAGFLVLGGLLYLLHQSFDTRALDRLLAQAEAAAEQDSLSEITKVLGNEDDYFLAVQQELEKIQGSPDKATLLYELLPNIRTGWKEWKDANDLEKMQNALSLIAQKGAQVRDGAGSLRPHEPTRESMSDFSVPPADLPAPENVAPLGRTLFTDFLIPVELGGTLLLVATIGAIAIAGRRREGQR
jgi:NADH:ubiquinone oxidoreductase subunit 6 (subunit J)